MSRKCKILSNGKYLRMDHTISGQSLTLVDSQNDGQDVPVIEYWTKNHQNGLILYAFRFNKKYLLTSELHLMSGTKPDPSNDCHWFQKEDLTGDTFCLKPITQKEKGLAIIENKYSLEETDYTMFTQTDIRE